MNYFDLHFLFKVLSFDILILFVQYLLNHHHHLEYLLVPQFNILIIQHPNCL